MIVWSTLSFLALLFILWKFALPLISQGLEDREKKISGEIQNAEELRAEAEKIKAEFDALLKTANEKADTIVQLAKDEARKMQEKSIEETEAKIRQMQREAEHEITVSRNKLLGEIRDYVSSVTISSTERILQRALNDDDRKRLVDESIEEVVRNLEQKA